MANLDYIDSYFKGELSREDIPGFELRIANDPDFADEVAFYCSAMQVMREEVIAEKKQHFRDIYPQIARQERTKIVGFRKWWPYVAAAAVLIAFVIGWQIWTKPPSLQRLASSYIENDMKQMNVLMSASEDSISAAKQLFNENKLTESLAWFEQLTRSASASAEESNKGAGIVSLRLKNYDKALSYFNVLENMQLYTNPGKFYHALTLLERNHPGDKEAAEQLLQEVVKQNLEMKEIAAEWLKDF